MAEGQGKGFIVATVVGIAGLAIMSFGVYSMFLTPELRPYRDVPGGDVERGRKAIKQYNCGSCHKIAGVEGANGQIGQPLAGLALRNDIVGILPNTPDDVVRWIQDPKASYPETKMPNLRVTKQDAIDIVAYLYALPP